MMNQKRDKDGKYTFSAGSGAKDIPTSRPTEVTPDFVCSESEEGEPYEDAWNAYQVQKTATAPRPDQPVDPRDIGLRERTNGTVSGVRDMSGRIAVGDIRVGDTVKGDDGKAVRVVKVSGGWVKAVTVEDQDGTTRQVRMNEAGSVELVSAYDNDVEVEAENESRPLTPAEQATLYATAPAVPRSQMDALTIQRAAEDAGAFYDDTYDGVAIGEYTVEASVDGARVYRWSGQGPEATQKLLATYPDAFSAVNSVVFGD